MATGSVYKKGTYYQAIIYYTERGGKRERRSRSTKQTNKQAANLELKKIIAQYTALEQAHTSTALMADFMLTWLNTKKAALRPNTFNDYDKSIHKHLIPWFAERGLTVGELRPHHIEELKADLLKAVSTDTTRTILGYVRAALDYAVDNEMVDKNVALKVKLPKRKKGFKANFYTLEELKALLSAVEGSNIEIPVMLISLLGLRKSEALGLKWDSIDWERKTVIIKDTAVMNGGAVLCAESTKTSSSNRSLVLPDCVIPSLKRERERQAADKAFCGNSYHNGDFVCCEADGSVTRPDRFYTRFKKCLEKNGFRNIRVHDLRHTAASLYLENGFTVKEVSEQLGHSSVEVTNRYLHAATASGRAIADKMNMLFTAKTVRSVFEKAEETSNIIYLPTKEKTPQTPVYGAL